MDFCSKGRACRCSYYSKSSDYLAFSYFEVEFDECPSTVACCCCTMQESDGCTELHGRSRRFHATRSCTPPPKNELLSGKRELGMAAQRTCKFCFRGLDILCTRRCLVWRIEGCVSGIGALCSKVHASFPPVIPQVEYRLLLVVYPFLAKTMMDFPPAWR